MPSRLLLSLSGEPRRLLHEYACGPRVQGQCRVAVDFDRLVGEVVGICSVAERHENVTVRASGDRLRTANILSCWFRRTNLNTLAGMLFGALIIRAPHRAFHSAVFGAPERKQLSIQFALRVLAPHDRIPLEDSSQRSLPASWRFRSAACPLRRRQHRSPPPARPRTARILFPPRNSCHGC